MKYAVLTLVGVEGGFGVQALQQQRVGGQLAQPRQQPLRLRTTTLIVSLAA